MAHHAGKAHYLLDRKKETAYTVFARSVAAATNVFNLSRREATIQERLLFESGVYLFDFALP